MMMLDRRRRRLLSKEEAETIQNSYKRITEEMGELEPLLWRMFVALLKLAGPILFLSLQVSSVATARDVAARKSVGSLSPLPNITLFTNCVVWTTYGWLKRDGTIFIPNLCGIISSVYCVVLFHLHSTAKPTKSYALSLLICVIIGYLAFVGDGSNIGLIGCVLSVLFTASPLAVVRTVIKDKSTASLPFFTSLVIWFNTTSWLFYGYLVADDVLIWGPNVLGFGLATLQMCLFSVYGTGKSLEPKPRNRVVGKIAAHHEV